MKFDFIREEIPHYKVMFNGCATIVVDSYTTNLNAKIVVKCDEKDKFDRKIGLGLAIYRSEQDKQSLFSCPKQAKFLRENFKYKQIANFYLHYFTGFSEKRYKCLCEQIENFEEGKWYYI